MDAKVLKAEERKIFGRKVKTLRNEGFLPGNIFGKKLKSLSIKLKLDDFLKAYKEVGETGLVEIHVGKEKRPVLIANVQMDPVKDSPLHVDFHQVDLKEKVTANVPIELTGESPAERQGLGTVVLYLNEIGVEALPSDLPENFKIDASNLTEVDQVVLIKDLKVDSSKVKISVDSEEVVAKVEPPQKEEEVVLAPVAEGEEVPVSQGEEPQEKPEEEGQEKNEEAPKA